MKQIITLLAFSILLLANAQATTAGSAKESKGIKTEAQTKKQQAAELKAQCPHYPSAQSYIGVISKPAAETFDSWKKNYPQEYTAYLRIFNYTK